MPVGVWTGAVLGVLLVVGWSLDDDLIMGAFFKDVKLKEWEIAISQLEEEP